MWVLEVWDQRPGHYTKVKKDDPGHNDGPSQKWYNNQDSDWFELICDKVDKQRKRSKDEFIRRVLFETKELYQKLPMVKNVTSFKSLMLWMDIVGIDRSKVDDIMKRMEEDYGRSTKSDKCIKQN